MLKFSRFIVLLILLLTACKKSYIISPEQKILFQMDITNYATGFTHYGYLIDSRGNILEYKNPDEWNFADQNSTLTAEQLEENLTRCIPSGKVLQSDLVRFSSYIDNIASSRVTALKKSDEQFSVKYTCYRYSPSNMSYKAYTIKVEGDYSGENLNFYTKKIVTWMKDINMNLLIQKSHIPF